MQDCINRIKQYMRYPVAILSSSNSTNTSNAPSNTPRNAPQLSLPMYHHQCIHVNPFAASSTGKTSLAYSSIPLYPSHKLNASSGALRSGPKYGASSCPKRTLMPSSCSRYPAGIGTLISMGPRTYLTGRPTPLEKAAQAWRGLRSSNASAMLGIC